MARVVIYLARREYTPGAVAGRREYTSGAVAGRREYTPGAVAGGVNTRRAPFANGAAVRA